MGTIPRAPVKEVHRPWALLFFQAPEVRPRDLQWLFLKHDKTTSGAANEDGAQQMAHDGSPMVDVWHSGVQRRSTIYRRDHFFRTGDKHASKHELFAHPAAKDPG